LSAQARLLRPGRRGVAANDYWRFAFFAFFAFFFFAIVFFTFSLGSKIFSFDPHQLLLKIADAFSELLHSLFLLHAFLFFSVDNFLFFKVLRKFV